jgi:hypothetical protein
LDSVLSLQEGHLKFWKPAPVKQKWVIKKGHTYFEVHMYTIKIKVFYICDTIQSGR